MVELNLSIAIVSLALAFGTNYGFDKVYGEKFINKFKNYRNHLQEKLLTSIRNLKFNKKMDFTKDIESKIEGFMTQWQEYQSIKEDYNSLISQRKWVFTAFLISGVFYLLHFILPIFSQTIVLGSPVINYINIIFAFGLMILVFFGLNLNDFQDKMTKYELAKE